MHFQNVRWSFSTRIFRRRPPQTSNKTWISSNKVFSWICSKSELPTSKYATSARNFDPHPMNNHQNIISLIKNDQKWTQMTKNALFNIRMSFFKKKFWLKPHINQKNGNKIPCSFPQTSFPYSFPKKFPIWIPIFLLKSIKIYPF